MTFLAGLAACGGGSSEQPATGIGAAAPACVPKSFTGAFAGEVTLCQNWQEPEQQTFWFLSQGSLLIPYSWFLALEQVDNPALFREAAHMDSLRYLPQQATPANPDALPIGFTRDEPRGSPADARLSRTWLGLSCAACHTGQVEYQGKRMLIDGAPTMADFEGLMRALVAAMRATLADQAKLDRFAARVAQEEPGIDETKLRGQLALLIERRAAWNRRNQGEADYGFARLDAIGAIFNEITATAMGVQDNAKPADAPVSYPFIWDTPQHDRVQWNGSVPNAGVGALGRNVGEVLGVFGALTLNAPVFSRSSVRIDHLGRLEGLLWKLQSPQWPETILPPIDQGRAAKGAEIYRSYCVSCHALIQRSDKERRIKAELVSIDRVRTDPTMARNFALREYSSGKLKGRLNFGSFAPGSSASRHFGATAGGVDFLGNAVIGVIGRNLLLPNTKDTIEAINVGREKLDLKAMLDIVRRPDPTAAVAGTVAPAVQIAGMPGTVQSPLVYKARPLNGIWATAPYLHNGSVRTMRQLLLPEDRRQPMFHVGSREYDPKEMGFVDAGGFLLDTGKPGNLATGHDGPDYHNAELAADPAALKALLEYLKTL